MKNGIRKICLAIILSVLCLSLTSFMLACGSDSDSTQSIDPVKLQDGASISLVVGGSDKTITVSDYINANGNTVTAVSSNTSVATVTVTAETVKISAVAVGTSKVTVTCKDISVEFNVTVTQKYTVTVDGAVAATLDSGEEYELPAATSTPSDTDFEFAWLIGEGAGSIHKKPGEKIIVNGNIIVTASQIRKAPVKLENNNTQISLVEGGAPSVITVSEYFTTHGNEVTAVSGNPDKVTAELNNAKTELTVAPQESTTQDVTVTLACGGETVEFTVTVTPGTTPSVKNATVTVSENVDICALPDQKYVVDLSKNVNNSSLIASYKVNGATNGIDGVNYTISISDDTFSMTPKAVSFTVTCVYSEGDDLTYTYNVNIISSAECRVANGSLTTDLTGWEVTGGIGAHSTEATFGDGDPANNVGGYFRGDDKTNTGTLTSPYFKLGGSKYVTFMLGAAKDDDCYVTLEKKGTPSNTLVAIWRNNSSELGLVTYKADLTSLESGAEYRIVIYDNCSEQVIMFDELVTYYASTDGLPSGAVEAVNELVADRSALGALIDAAEEIKDAGQGDYTADSFNTLTQAINSAKAVYNKLSSKQSEITSATTALTAAKDGLTVREITAKSEADKNHIVVVGVNYKDLYTTDFIDDNSLSNVTYSVVSSDTASANLTVTYTEGTKKIELAGVSATTTDVTVTIKAYYKTVEKLTVTLTVKVLNAPERSQEEITNSVDTYTLTNNVYTVTGLNDNVTANGHTLTYTASTSASGVTVSVDGTTLTATLGGTYTETPTAVNITVTATSQEAATVSVSYTLKVNVISTSAYRVENGNFDDGLDGWTKTGNIGAVSNLTKYWIERVAFNNEGNFFAGYTNTASNEHEGDTSEYLSDGDEIATGTLVSSAFTVSNSRVITFKLGGAKNNCYVEIVDSANDTVYARYYNTAWTDADKKGCSLNAYVATLPEAAAGKSVKIRVVDNAVSNYGLIFCDSFVTYYATAPTEGFINAVEYNVNQVYNGGFDYGLNGWIKTGNIGDISSLTTYWVERVAFNNEGNFFSAYTNVGNDEHEGDTSDYLSGGDEGAKGTLVSSAFTVSANRVITFKLGGAKNNGYVEIVDSANGTVYARYYNTAWTDVDRKGCSLNAYKATLPAAAAGKTVYIRVTDNGYTNYGLIFCDSFVTYYATAPTEGFINAVEYSIYDIYNGNFEMGNHNGWALERTNDSGDDFGVVTDQTNYWTHDQVGIPYGKDGTYLFSWWTDDNGTQTEPEFNGGEHNREGQTGTLTSSMFTVKSGATLSFKFGGGGGNDEIYIQLLKADGTEIGKYFNTNANDGKLVSYNITLTSITTDTECYIKVVDNATKDWGCLAVDSFAITY